MKKKLLLIILILLAALLISLFFFFRLTSQTNKKTYSIMITEEGFTPNTLHIKKSDTVVFTSKLKDAFWPASDPHPTHEIYPEFDPQQPIEANTSWSFTFTKPGKWGFHNHLDPWMRGTIYVDK